MFNCEYPDESDQARFAAVCSRAVDPERPREGIGTLGEKTLHAVIKDFIEPDPARQEVTIGTFVADIVQGDTVIEVQTAGFNRLRAKIDAFVPEYKLSIIHPLPARKWLSWYDPETGERISRRLSPKRGRAADALRELYRIRPWLLEPGVSVTLCYVDLDEHRLLDGYARQKKKGSTRVDRVPVALDRIEHLRQPEDYLDFLPPDLPDEFRSKDLREAGSYRDKQAFVVLRLLRDFGLVELCGQEGRAPLYRLTDRARQYLQTRAVP